MSLTRSSDRKVASSVTAGGNVRVRNAFGLPSGKPYSCPGATSVCERICYAGKIEKQYVNVFRTLNRNFEELLYADYLGGIPAMRALIVEMLTEFVTESVRKSAPLLFRIHWDGDFFSADYATAWADAMRLFPNVQFWAYTRTFSVAHILSSVENLSLYLSVDKDNIDTANDTRAELPTIQFATLADTFSEAREMGDSPTNCPELNGALPLISEKGSACVRCGLCVFQRKDVAFSITKK